MQGRWSDSACVYPHLAQRVHIYVVRHMTRWESREGGSREQILVVRTRTYVAFLEKLVAYLKVGRNPEYYSSK